MAGRGRGLGRGRGKPKLNDTPLLSEENKQKLIKDVNIVPDQFTDDTANKQTSNHSQTANQVLQSTPVTTPPQTTLSPHSDHTFSKETTPISNGSGPERSKSSPAKLNPRSNEFVPKSRLNVMAAEFIPLSYLPVSEPSENGKSSPVNDDDLTTLDILEGFDRRSAIDDPLLVEVADMLINATIYPGTYDKCLMDLSDSIKSTYPSDEVLCDIGDMLLQWGINNTGLRYTAVRICDFMCKADLNTRFRNHFFTVLQKLFQEEKNKTERTSEDIDKLMEFSLFMAEMFYRVKVGNDQVIWVLGLAVTELMFILIDIKKDHTVKCACHILKLTGYLLENEVKVHGAFNPREKMDTIVLALKHLCNDKSLGKRVCEVIISTLTFKGKNYERVPPQPESEKQAGLVEAPVKRQEDWELFVDESGNVIEGYDDQEYESYYEISGEDFDPNIDDEIMKGYEEFLQDFEDHLLLQEFGTSN